MPKRPVAHTLLRLLMRAGLLGSVLGLPLVAQVTEAPTTVAPGQWLVEADLVSVAYDRHTYQRDGVHFRSTYLGSTLLSTGVVERLDVQFGLEFWREEQATSNGAVERGRGLGDAWLRAKWNFAGDEATGPAWALLPYVKLPLAQEDIGNGETEPGLVLVYGRPLAGEKAFNGMIGLDWLADGDGGRSPTCYGSMSVTWPCRHQLCAYLETVAIVSEGASREWSGELGVGLTHTTKRGLTLDLALYVGVTRSAPDWTPVLRLVWPL